MTKQPAPIKTKDLGNYHINDDGDISFKDDENVEEYTLEKDDHQDNIKDLNLSEFSKTYSRKFNLDCHIMSNHISNIKCPQCNMRSE